MISRSLVLLMLVGALPTAYSAPSMSVDTYLRAERFLAWNGDRLVKNANIEPHWIHGEDRFWYLRTQSSGDREFVLVDAVTSSKRPAFDHRNIALGLSELTRSAVSPG